MSNAWDQASAARGYWISFEGIEGCGKTTQLQRLAARLQKLGLAPRVTREPGGTALGARLRSLLLEPSTDPMDPWTELLLYVADRVQHLSEVILPALGRGEIVLCDRYVDATLAYQGAGRGLDRERIRELHRHPPLNRLPDRTLLFDLDVEVALGRARRRDRNASIAATEGRFEQERIEFHRRVREGYLELAAADPDRVRVIDASGEVERIEQRVRDLLSDLWPGLESRA